VKTQLKMYLIVRNIYTYSALKR